MSQKINHRRGETRQQDNGPRWESHTPSAGSNSTHVAKARKEWKRRSNRSERRTGATSPKIGVTHSKRVRPDFDDGED